jgi:hypothetical protein
MFTTKNLLVTPHVDGQLYPAGTYVFQSSRDSGLREWTQQVRHQWCWQLPQVLFSHSLLSAAAVRNGQPTLQSTTT